MGGILESGAVSMHGGVHCGQNRTAYERMKIVGDERKITSAITLDLGSCQYWGRPRIQLK